MFKGVENLNSLLGAAGFFDAPEPVLKFTAGFVVGSVGLASAAGLDAASNANVGFVSFADVTLESFFSDVGAGKLLFNGMSILGTECMNGNATFGRFAGAGASSSCRLTFFELTLEVVDTLFRILLTCLLPAFSLVASSSPGSLYSHS